MTRSRVVCVVDDDESVREALVGLIRSAGFEVRAFASAEEFLSGFDPANTHCLVLDVKMPGMSGPDLQECLLAQGQGVPIVFITAREEEGLRNRLLERGASAYLVKPFHEDALLNAVRTGTLSQRDREP